MKKQKKLVVSLTAVALISLSAAAALNSTTIWAKAPEAVASRAMHETRSHVFAIENMNCPACPITVKKATARVAARRNDEPWRLLKRFNPTLQKMRCRKMGRFPFNSSCQVVSPLERATSWSTSALVYWRDTPSRGWCVNKLCPIPHHRFPFRHKFISGVGCSRRIVVHMGEGQFRHFIGIGGGVPRPIFECTSETVHRSIDVHSAQDCRQRHVGERATSGCTEYEI